MNKRWPDWEDEGKKVTIRTDYGRVVTGTLVFKGFVEDGEDGYPLWKVKDDVGVLYSLLDDCEFLAE